MDVAVQNRMETLEVEDGIFCEHNQWAHDCLACGTRAYGPYLHELLPALTLDSTCIYCGDFTIYVCEHCHASMCGHCVPGTDCPNCNPAAFEGNTMMSAVQSWDDPDESLRLTLNAYHQDGCTQCGYIRDECVCEDYFHCPCGCQDDAPEIPADVRAMVPASNRPAFTCRECGCVIRSGIGICGECLSETPFWQQHIKRALAGAALLAALVLPGHASADTLAQVPAGCAITHTFEDASAVASCADGTRVAFDADGGFMQDHGIVFFYRAPGTWYQVK